MHNLFSSSPIDVLVIDDEVFVRDALRLYLEGEGCSVRVAAGASEALSLFSEKEPEVALLDVRMPGVDGLQLLKMLKAKHSDVEIVMATGCSSLETALEAMRLGAYDYVTKPIVDLDNDLLRVVEKAAERHRLRRSNRALSGDLQVARHEVRSVEQILDRQQGPWQEVARIMRAVLTSDVPCVRSLLLEAIGASCGSDRVALYLREGEQLIASSISGLDDPDLLEPLPCQFFPDAKEKWRMGPSPPPWKDAIAWLFPLFLGGKIEGLIILAGDARGLPDPALAAPLRALADLATLLLVGDGVIHGASDRASGSTFS